MGVKMQKIKRYIIFLTCILYFGTTFYFSFSTNQSLLNTNLSDEENLNLNEQISLSSESKSKKSILIDSLIQKYNFIPPQFNYSNIYDWKKTTFKADRDFDGLNDQLAKRLEVMLEPNIVIDSNGNNFLSKDDIIGGFFGNEKKNSEHLSYNHVPVIINFPDGEINSIFPLFESLGGEIKSKYSTSINGFAGTINYNGLNLFCNILNDQEVPFIVEEDSTSSLRNYIMTTGGFYWIDATYGYRCSLSGADDSAQTLSLPFTFPFYDNSFDTIYVCTNGFVSFTRYTNYYNIAFPTTSYYNMIAPFWDDLVAASPCNIYYRSLSNPNRFVIEWKDIYSYGGSRVGTFEVILYETGDIIFSYDYLDYVNTYTSGLNYGYDLGYYNQYTGLSSYTNDFSIHFEYVGDSPPEDPPDPDDPIPDPVPDPVPNLDPAILSKLPQFGPNSSAYSIAAIFIVFLVIIAGVTISKVYNKREVIEPTIIDPSIRKEDVVSHKKMRSVRDENTNSWSPIKNENRKRAIILKKVGNRYRASKNYENAINSYERALKLNPNDKETKLLLMQCKTELVSINRSKVIIAPPPNVLITPPPEQIHKNWYSLGLKSLKEGSYEDAIRYFKKEIELNPSFRDAWSKMGITYGRLKNFQKMTECYKKVIEIDQTIKDSPESEPITTSKEISRQSILLTVEEPERRKKSAKDCYIMGYEFSLLKNYNKAINYFKRAIKIEPKFKEAWFELGKCYSKTGVIDNVIKCNLKSIVINPKLIKAWEFLAIAYLTSGDYQKAIKCYEKIVEIDPKSKRTLKILGLFYYNIENYQKAIEFYKKVLDIELYDKKTWINLVKCYSKLENHQKVIDCCEEIVKMDPLDKKGWYNLGVAYSHLKDHNKSFDCFMNANKIDPLDEKILRILNSLRNKESKIEDNKNRKNDQKHIITEEMLDDEAEKWYKMGNLFFHLQHYKKAIEFYVKVVAKFPQFKDAWHKMGISFGRLGNLQKLIEYSKK